MAKNARELAPKYHIDNFWGTIKEKIEKPRKKRLLFIGALNLGQAPNGGEEYKNQVFLNKINSFYDCKVIDTHEWRNQKIIVISILKHCYLGSYDSIIVSASSNSTYRLIQLCSLSKSVLKKFSYFVIGGYFPEALNEGIYKVKYYKSLKSIIVEGEILKDEILNKQKLKNLIVIPNFKKFEFQPTLENKNYKIIQFVFLSLITKDKGADLIFKAVEILISKGYLGRFSVTLYGKIDDVYEQEFKANLNASIQHKGYLNIMENSLASYQVLSAYHCMLFPSYFLGEGFPGVIIDAYIAGLPVIASDWHMNSEVIENGVSGIIIPPKDEFELSMAMKTVIDNPQLLNEMSLNVRKKARDYHIDNVWEKIETVIES
jgi:glycosyltransferase involved in cell wall biosynthesis